MTKRMLIDATHKEETRVAITDGNKLVEYDYESQSRKPLKGSIFLAKVTRVEPSLQAAFVNFGGNRHGFLPFSEIHPDYFRIPVADREALMAEQEELIKEHDEEEAFEETFDESLDEDDLDSGSDESLDSDSDENEENSDEVEEDKSEAVKSDKPAKKSKELKVKPEEVVEKVEEAEAKEPVSKEEVPKEESSKEAALEGKPAEDNGENKDAASEQVAPEGVAAENAENAEGAEKVEGVEDDKKDTRRRGQRGRGRGRNSRRPQYRNNRNVEVVGGDDIEQEKRFRFNLRRKYKIQEVIKRGQIMLVQANKEERGNKGAAVGSYLSLPGRYCVLMPNSPRAGGVSRKIANHKDRARMRDIVKSLEVPKGMSVIVRTAGVTRTKSEIKRDLDYLMRLWDSIRELTLESTAPSLVYEEADLIKRSVRDLYTRDVEEVLVSGEEGFKIAKGFMKMMIPSHVKKVVKYEESQYPLFNRYQIESQINEIGLTDVRLRSGGYLVINPTEALISIDVNSGKSTKGRHIEETALKTNLEAAEEVARQLKLRDLGGLVVIDFIDMEDRRNNGKVERRMKESLSTDRARVQVGRISSFGLMELSRQRLSPSLTEAQYEKCKVCGGVGIIPTADAMSITVLRAIEEEGIRGRAAQVIVRVNNNVALYILNHKRNKLDEIEKRYDFEILLRIDDEIPAADYLIEVSKPSGKGEEASGAEEHKEVRPNNKEARPASDDADDKEGSPRRGRGRRGGRGNRSKPRDNDGGEGSGNKPAQQVDVDGNKAEVPAKDAPEAGQNDEKPKRSRRPRRKPRSEDAPVKNVEATDVKVEEPKAMPEKVEEKVAEAKPAPKAKKPAPAKPVVKEAAAEVKPAQEKPVAEKKAEAPKAKAKPKAEAKKHEVVNKPTGEKKKGWWNRLVD